MITSKFAALLEGAAVRSSCVLPGVRSGSPRKSLRVLIPHAAENPHTTSRISKSFAKTSVSMPHVANQFTGENSYSAIPSCRREVGACVSWSTTAGNQPVLQCLSKYYRLKIFPGLNSATPYIIITIIIII